MSVFAELIAGESTSVPNIIYLSQIPKEDNSNFRESRESYIYFCIVNVVAKICRKSRCPTHIVTKLFRLLLFMTNFLFFLKTRNCSLLSLTIFAEMKVFSSIEEGIPFGLI